MNIIRLLLNAVSRSDTKCSENNYDEYYFSHIYRNFIRKVHESGYKIKLLRWLTNERTFGIKTFIGVQIQFMICIL